MASSMAVAARVNPEIGEWVKEKADERQTTIGRIVEDTLREKYREEEGSDGFESSVSSKSLPEAVYVPDSDKYNYAVKFQRDGKTRRKYYKTRSGAVNRAESERA